MLLAGLLVTVAGTSAQAVAAIPLGTAGSYAVLAGAGITNTGPTVINGDLGTFPTTSFTGSGSVTLTGTDHGGDGVTQVAKNDLVNAYTVAAGAGPASSIVADLAGQTLTAGVYNSASSVGLSGALTLDAEGDPNAVFVFQVGSALTTASGSLVTLTNGAQACNVFWQVGSSATLGTGSTFRGSILALTDITMTTGATMIGRVLARNGAVTLDTNTISRPICAAAPTAVPTVPGSPTATAAPTATSTATPTASGVPTATSTATGTASATGTATATATATSTASAAPTAEEESEVTGGDGGQVQQVPVGAVRAGDGSTSEG